MKRIRYQFLVTLPLSISLIVLMAVALIVATPLSANPPRTSIATPSSTPNTSLKPLVLLTVYNPWLMVIGSDEPTFALYDNGLVIYQRLGPADAPELASVLLTADELEALKLTLNIDKDLYTLDSNNDYITKTDQPTNVIRLFDPVLGEKVFSIYGDLYSDPEARRLAAPKRLIDLFDVLVKYAHDRAEVWLPDHIEVILWPDTTNANATEWPEDWPTLNDPTTVKRDSVYSVYIDIKDRERFLELRLTTTAFHWDGKNWAFAFRYPFPHESI